MGEGGNLNRLHHGDQDFSPWGSMLWDKHIGGVMHTSAQRCVTVLNTICSYAGCLHCGALHTNCKAQHKMG